MKNTILTLCKTIHSYTKSHKRIAVVVSIIILGLSYYLLTKSAAVAVTYQYANVARGDISSTVSGTGQVTPNSQVDLKPKVNANVIAVYVKSGERVKSGQILFRLDATDANKEVRDATTALESANLALQKLQTPQTADVLSINNSLKQEADSQRDQDSKVATAYMNLLSANLQAVPSVAYTTETAPTITGSYTKGVEGDININVYQGGNSGYSFSLSGVATGQGQVNTIVPQPLGDTGLYIKWNGAKPQTNWVVSIPNKQSSSYLSSLNAYQAALDTRTTANAQSDRNIASLKQKLADLFPTDSNLDVQIAKLQITQKENALLDARQALSNYTITAPFDGVMASVSVDIGSSAVMASANSSTALGTIVTDKKLAQITLNESDIVKVRLGQKAKITFDAIDGLVINGEVIEITTLGTVTSGVVTYKAKVAFDTNDMRILPNMSVSVDIITDSKNDVLYIPSQALKRDAFGYYVETDDSSSSLRISSSTRSFMGASSTKLHASSTIFASSSGYRNHTGSSTYQKTGSANATTTISKLIRIPVTIGIQNDTKTEVISGLFEGQRFILKKVTAAQATTSSAPSITSFFRPQGVGRPATVSTARAQ